MSTSTRPAGRAAHFSKSRIAAALAGAVALGTAVAAPTQAADPTPRENRDSGFFFVNARFADGELSLGLTKDFSWMDGTQGLPVEDLSTVAVHVGDEYQTTAPESEEWQEYVTPGSTLWETDPINGPLSLGFSAVDIDGSQFADEFLPVTVTLEGLRGSDGAAPPGHLWWGGEVADYNPPSNAILGSFPVQDKSEQLTPQTNFPFTFIATAPGGYCADLTVSGLLADGTTTVTSPVTTVAVAVGDQSDPTTVVCGDEELIPSPPTPTPSPPTPTPSPPTPTTSTSTTTVAVQGPTAFGRDRTATVNVTADGQPTDGPVTVKLGATTVATTELTGGTAQVAIPATVAVGTHHLSATYAGSDDPDAPVAGSVASTSFTVVKAATTAKAKLAKKTIGKTQRAKITVRVRIPGAVSEALPVGKVRVYDGKKRIKTIVLKARQQGRIILRLPSLKPGKHKIKVVYAGSTNTEEASPGRAVLRVTK